jgi:hypothetical protein
MNWREFKEEVEDNGVRDDTEINLISTSGNFTNNWELRIYFEKDGTISIFAYDK